MVTLVQGKLERFVGCVAECIWFQQPKSLQVGDEAGQDVFRPFNRIQRGVDFLQTLTPDEGVVLLLVGVLTLLACLGFAIWIVIT
jgi:hypothetical protein